ncbi:hypothetical protein MRS44_018499 [Fusarium solani]|uniref:uncharacterized protein n=1 Tax=Fusarium solani TaxID=169388 RepID=UPI0032C454F2|nr:hypothetical protein MRS44_018499 [Fusarium solani]
MVLINPIEFEVMRSSMRMMRQVFLGFPCDWTHCSHFWPEVAGKAGTRNPFRSGGNCQNLRPLSGGFSQPPAGNSRPFASANVIIMTNTAILETRLAGFMNLREDGMSARRTSVPSWQPKFDIRETGEAYELHGELPGINKENVHIEFTEPQTMLIRGKTKRTYTTGTPPTGLIEGTTTSGAITEAGEGAKKASEEVHKSVPHETGTEATEKEKPKAKEPVDKAKYWLSERSVGEFSRSFNFPTPVDQESVTASFKDGILNIVVPKAKKQESRRIAIS